jgi:hypothetical protein
MTHETDPRRPWPDDAAAAEGGSYCPLIHSTVAALISAEAFAIKNEIAALLASVQGRRPTKQQIAQAKELRARAKALDSGAEELLLRYLSLEMAVRQRLGRTDVEGEEVLPADVWVAKKILAGLLL